MHLETVAEKCTGCRMCENVCSLKHEGAIWPERARIRILAKTGNGPFTPHVCHQCEDAACAAACPVEAITRSEHTGAWIVNNDKCIGCQSCIDACPYHAIFFDLELGRVFKCDLCGGEPECAMICPYGAIQKVI